MEANERVEEGVTIYYKIGPKHCSCAYVRVLVQSCIGKGSTAYRFSLSVRQTLVSELVC